MPSRHRRAIVAGMSFPGRWLGGALDTATGSGVADLRLALGVPFAAAGVGSTVKGSLVLAGNDVLAISADAL